jgi:hypothetical protein
MEFKALRPLLIPVSALALVLGACADGSTPTPVAPAAAPLFGTSSSSTLLECPTDVGVAATDTIDVLGGTLKVVDSVGGTHEVVFPDNAVSTATVFTLAVPAAQYMEVRVTARDLLTGEEQSITFPTDAQPTLAISYKRCTRSDVLNKELFLFNIDEATNAVLEGPFGTKEGNPDDPRVEGKVPHFSDYAVGTG